MTGARSRVQSSASMVLNPKPSDSFSHPVSCQGLGVKGLGYHPLNLEGQLDIVST